MTESTDNTATAQDAANSTADEIRLDGNAAVNLAAEQSKLTGGRNIPTLSGIDGLDDLPVAEDTANLRLGPNLHDGLLIFAHDGENYISYESRIWKLDKEGNATDQDQRETGFWRINDKDEIEFICCNSSGVVEIFYGNPLNERAWEVESASTMVTATGPAELGPGKRLYGLMPTNELGWVDERMVGKELRPRMSAQLARVVG